MKARVRATGEVVEVHRTASGWNADSLTGCRFFNDSDLDFDYEIWEAFRANAAKDILCAIIGKINTHVYDITDINKERYCVEAVIWANELISILSNHD